MAKKNIQMTEGSLYKNVIKFALPLIATAILSQLFHNVDMIVVGQFCGKEALAAVGAVGSIVNLIVAVFLGISGGSGIVMAQCFGSGDEDSIKRAVHTAVYTAFLTGAFLTCAGILFARPLLGAMSIPADIIEDSALYLRIYFSAVMLRMIYAFTSAILRALGDSKTPFIYLTIGGVLNAIFNLFFVTVCGMTVDGVAWGTVISEAFAGTMCLFAVMRRRDAARFSFGGFKKYYDKNVLLKIIKIGIPAGIESGLFSLSNAIVQANVNAFGVDVIAGSSAASGFLNICNSVPTGMGTTASMFMGQNFGAGRFDRIKKLPRALILWSTAILLTFAAVGYAFTGGIISLFIKSGASAEAYRMGILKLRIVVWSYAFTGARAIYSGLIRATGKSFNSMIISLITVCGVRIAFIEIVVRIYNDPIVIFIAYPVSFIVAMIAMASYFYPLMKKEKRLYEERERLKAAK